MPEADPTAVEHAARVAATFRASLRERPVYPVDVDPEGIRKALGELQDAPMSPSEVVDELVAACEPGIVASGGPRYFGFVVGGALEAAAAADVLTTGWDQPTYNVVSAPAAAMVEEVAGTWLKELLGLPPTASFGFVTGGQGANTVCLAAARHEVLGRAGWDVAARGLREAPRVRVVATAERHGTIDRALRLLGFGTESIEAVATDADGAIDVDALHRVLLGGPSGPTIVSLQAGNVDSGSIDDFTTAIAIAHEAGAWVHVDGAFGLWAGACPTTRLLVRGVDAADSWATDGHKWLNVPYDCGYALTAHPDAHRAAVAYDAAYLHNEVALRAPGDYVLESSHRARGFATWAALRQLGRDGVADLIGRCCGFARQFADQLGAIEGIEIKNRVALNQVLVRFVDDATTDRVVKLVQRSGECWMGATTWHDMRLMRISVCGHETTGADVERSVAAIGDAFSRAR